MRGAFEKVQGIFKKDQRGITGLETAIVLIAFVVVASVFAFAVITTGLFSSEEAQSSAQAGVEAAKSTMTPKGSMVLEEAQATGTASATDALGETLTDTLDFVAEGCGVLDSGFFSSAAIGNCAAPIETTGTTIKKISVKRTGWDTHSPHHSGRDSLCTHSGYFF